MTLNILDMQEKVNNELRKGLRRLADSPDLALEHRYRGKEREGMSLAEWFSKRASKIDR